MHINYAVTFLGSLQNGENHEKKARVYEEDCGSKNVSFRRTKNMLGCHIAGHLSWVPSEVTRRNEESHQNVKEAGNVVVNLISVRTKKYAGK
jgi:hypothetical protein